MITHSIEHTIKLTETDLLEATFTQFGGDGWGDIMLHIKSSGNGRGEDFSATQADLVSFRDFLSEVINEVAHKRSK